MALGLFAVLVLLTGSFEESERSGFLTKVARVTGAFCLTDPTLRLPRGR